MSQNFNNEKSPPTGAPVLKTVESKKSHRRRIGIFVLKDCFNERKPQNLEKFEIKREKKVLRVDQTSEVILKSDEASPKDHAYDNIFIFRKIQDSNNGLLIKVLWFLIAAVCFSLTVAQVMDRLRYYFSEPVSVSVQIERNFSMEFPSLTICNKNPFEASVVRRLKHELVERRGLPAEAVTNITTDDLIDEFGVLFIWETAGFNVPNKIRECFIYRTVHCSKYGNWTPIFTILGLCYTYKFEAQMLAAGPYQSLYLVMDADDEMFLNSRGWRLLVHQADEFPGLLVRTEALTLYPNNRIDIVVEQRKFHTMNTKAKPCLDDKNYRASICLAHCLFRFIAANISCRLPNMIFKQGEEDLYPLCNSSSSHKLAKALHEENVSEEGAWNSRECRCPRQCRENIFSTKNDIRSWPNDNQTVARIYYEDLSYESVEETPAYGIVSLLSDTGGIMGLFLGACVLTIFEVFEVLLLSLKKKL